MKIVYVAGPFRGATAWDIEQNVRRAETLGLEVARAGAMPLIPHANTRFFHGQCVDGFSPTDAFWLVGTMELLRRCDAIILTDDYERSSGALAEAHEAERLKLRIFYPGPICLDALRTWAIR